MKFTRRANANWKGTGMEGKGTISTQSTTLDNAQLSFKTRFADGVGTNPEELIAAAHSGCFTMQLTAYITEAGFAIDQIQTKCDIDFVDGAIQTSHLTVQAKVQDISEDAFQELVTKAEKNLAKLLELPTFGSMKPPVFLK